MFNKILVVCVGNICRSPTAERLLRAYQPDLIVDSAGLGALVGKGADERATSVAKEHNLSLAGHFARQVSGRMCREYDLILAMEKRHINALCEIAPEMRGKVMLFGHWDSEREIPDPYRKSREAFEAVYTLLDQSAQQWAQALKVQQG
ncbi:MULTISPECIES: low molecular weight protein-tyrosine-phosphatase Wzb [Lelliottia]|jgi:protein-tyrosine phosphatase|uniref:protein-tyrosine-phosphatase n=1 Tax=Lelliottia wanjuensis TaxID=3050585 RepID=A0AAP4D1C9_9ENTR|nr:MULTISPECIES: low molecular weight protein-tyrosine-phosphatase Wzb [unclassified Lelliottia]MDK9357006.1 low molecular weight protein-tyrosine-phosphatase Wzb [Lelliottia sp. V106_16]MDK9362325.1 low molecular weight protein-tyrosine-phosphatase Wzb [Lelliottia sp. V106_12]MDK9372322.1 low molecular weight protein-tyrosine-phosphatase Wzb [Lelliottia sp. V106_10]MDK9585713.1 low molecular weight protein-tyrosine-phosphatase Wzb [Lelliottia sp. V86_10]MDK9599126.1 low molecular weight prote